MIKQVRGERGAIWTSTWFQKLPPKFQRIGISRYKPRGFKREHWNIKALAPGRWYNTVPPKQYLELYGAILDQLNPQDVVDTLFAIGPNPVMVCYESPVDIHAGTKFCHRHMVAKWLHDTLGVVVRELNAPDPFNPWRAFERLDIPVPIYPRKQPVNLLAGG